MNGRAVAEYDTMTTDKVPNIHTNLHFFNIDDENTANKTMASPMLYTDKMVLRDMYGNR